jgi:hypothetical protein
LYGRDHLHEGVPHGEHGVDEAELSDPRIVERIRPAKRLLQSSGGLLTVVGDQRHLT